MRTMKSNNTANNKHLVYGTAKQKENYLTTLEALQQQSAKTQQEKNALLTTRTELNTQYESLKNQLNQLRTTIKNKQQLVAAQSTIINKLKTTSTAVTTKIAAAEYEKQQQLNQLVSTVKPNIPPIVIQEPSSDYIEEQIDLDQDNSPIEPEQPYEINLDYLTEDERELARLVNEYRLSLGLEQFSISRSLTIVARTHVIDSNMYSPKSGVDDRGIACNGHSWSSNGSWTPVCYTSDHQYAQLMWDKPRELTNYPGNGYEISAWTSGEMTPSQALALWKNSSGHNNVIIGNGSWASLTTMGIGIYDGYSHIWFGKENDPALPIE